MGNEQERENAIKDIQYLLEKMTLEEILRVRWYASRI